MENSKSNIIYKFHFSGESDSESCESEDVEPESDVDSLPPELIYPDSEDEIDSLPPELIYPDSEDDMVLAGLVPKYIPRQLEVQRGDGVNTRKRAAAATTRMESPILEPKNKTSKKLKAKNRKQQPPLEPQPSSPRPTTSAEALSARLSPMPGPSRLPDVEQPQSQVELSDNNSGEETRLLSTNLYEQETKVFENEDFVLLMQKSDHQRQKVTSLILKIKLFKTLFKIKTKP